MAGVFARDDLKQIETEYKSYFPEFCLERRITQSPSNSIDQIHLKTQEGKCLVVSVCDHGWFVVGKDGYFDTFEALMNTYSGGFRDTFAHNLLRKLEHLEEKK